MDIAALSMAMSQMNVRTEANVSVMKKTIDQAETNGQEVVKMLEQSVQPHIGSRIDIRG
ncbi:putative motility protein [Planococcus antarcticus DSM 14505]|uniref:Motility protein n=1 Tax=Planococcus antarcticus DSM 14505 TaxID=1185653 RepID=A0ABM6D1G9_9BACL|nr:YjfB family protein [Planococcus antarcticus]ANU09195.1 putative motility protein [Planococcus antarcticus DSM 14505]